MDQRATTMGDEAVVDYEDYSPLENFRVEVDGEEASFCLCFWLYLMNSTTFPATIIHQVSNYPAASSFLFFFFFTST